MSLQEEIKGVFSGLPVEFTEKGGLVTARYTVAERKAFLSRKTLVYMAKFRVDDERREVRFTEMLKESGFGLSGGEGGFGGGVGLRKETYKIGKGGREGTLQEQSSLFGKKYAVTFDYGRIRKAIEATVTAAGYTFKYQIAPIGM